MFLKLIVCDAVCNDKCFKQCAALSFDLNTYILIMSGIASSPKYFLIQFYVKMFVLLAVRSNYSKRSRD